MTQEITLDKGNREEKKCLALELVQMDPSPLSDHLKRAMASWVNHSECCLEITTASKSLTKGTEIAELSMRGSTTLREQQPFPHP